MFGEFMGEAFGVFEMGDHLRRRHGRQFGVVFERGLRDGLWRGDAKEKREQPARGEWQTQWARDAGEPREQKPLSIWRVSVLECAGPPALSSAHWPAKSSRGLEHSKTLSRRSRVLLHGYG